MRVPIVCVDERLRQYAQMFADCLSRPQFQHFVIVLVGGLWVPQSAAALYGDICRPGMSRSFQR
jgi:hypothetical protein